MLTAGQIEEGTDLLLNKVEAEPQNKSAWLLLCGVASRTQNWNLGLKSFGALVKLRPSSGLASSGLVQSFCENKRFTEALEEIERFKKVADVANDNDKSVLAEFDAIVAKIKLHTEE